MNRGKKVGVFIGILTGMAASSAWAGPPRCLITGFGFVQFKVAAVPSKDDPEPEPIEINCPARTVQTIVGYMTRDQCFEKAREHVGKLLPVTLQYQSSTPCYGWTMPAGAAVTVKKVHWESGFVNPISAINNSGYVVD